MIEKEAYFRRIGLPEDTKVEFTREFLCKLQYQHVISVPYENLDILDNRSISLNADDLYNKIVLQNRGGYCFEVNALLKAFLLELGFKVNSHFARYLRGEKSIPVRRHHVLAVQAENGVYVCDVGIGQTAPRFPLLLKAGLVQEQGTETYKFERDAMLGWVLWELRNGSWSKYFSFTDDVALDIDFIQPSFYCQMHPDSPFNKTNIVAIKTPDGRKSIDGNTFKIFTGSELTYVEENCTDARILEILKKHFGITRP
jgi:N-hydroxyarylamine O-acetyltransferase